MTGDFDLAAELRANIAFYDEQVAGFERNAIEFDQKAQAARNHAYEFRMRLRAAKSALAHAEEVARFNAMSQARHPEPGPDQGAG